MPTGAKLINRKVVLKFPHQLVEEPIVCRLVKHHNLDVSILMARITPREEGLLVLDLTGDESSFNEGVDYVKALGVNIQPLSQDIVRNDDLCTHCGACVTVCPSAALSVDPETKEVIFREEHCIACELCVPACPFHAMEVNY